MKRYAFGVLREHKPSRLLFLLCWFAYYSAYLGRLNYSVALAAMVENDLFSKADAGMIGMAYFLFYGFGQILFGFLGDRLSPFKMIFCGLSLSALANFGMGLCSSYVPMIVVWGLNGVAQSMLWSPVLAVFANILQGEHRKKACIHISTTVPAGTLISYLLSVGGMNLMGWQGVFFAAGGALVVAVLVWGIGGRYIHRFLEPAPSQAGLSVSADPQSSGEKLGLWKILLLSGGLLMMVLIAIQGVLKDGVGTWVPTMITETFAVTPTFAVLLSMLLPFANLIGPYVGNFFNNRVFRNEITTAGLFFLFALGALACLFFAGSWNVWLSILLLCVITLSMHAVNTMIITMVPVRLAGSGRTASITGLLNSTAYIGTAISTYGIGYFAEHIGWNSTVLLWVLLGIFAVAVSIIAIPIWKRFRVRTEQEP